MVAWLKLEDSFGFFWAFRNHAPAGAFVLLGCHHLSSLFEREASAWLLHASSYLYFSLLCI